MASVSERVRQSVVTCSLIYKIIIVPVRFYITLTKLRVHFYIGIDVATGIRISQQISRMKSQGPNVTKSIIKPSKQL